MSAGLIVLLGGIVALVAFVIWWLFFETEGVFLGRRVVIWLYDLYAGRYDAIVQVDDVEDHLHLAQPIMAACHPATDPLVLDVGTGTGRLPLALCQHARFEGHIIGLDLSHKMLQRAADKLRENAFGDYVSWIHQDAQTLPFPDGALDVVTCLEVVEFTPDPAQTLRELIRVLRPGGLLVTTLRVGTPFYLSRVWSADRLRDFLQENGVEHVEILPWLETYNLVQGRRAGESAFAGQRPLSDLLLCPRCRLQQMIEGNDGSLYCENCGAAVPRDAHGIISYAAAQISS